MKPIKLYEEFNSSYPRIVDEIFDILGGRVEKKDIFEIMNPNIDEGFFSWLGGLFKNPKMKRQLDKYADELTKVRIQIGTLELEGDPTEKLKAELKDRSGKYQSSSDYGENDWDSDEDSKVHQKQIDILQKKEEDLEEAIDAIGEENEVLKKYVLKVKMESRIKSTEALMRVADGETKRILGQIKQKDQRETKNLDKEIQNDARRMESFRVTTKKTVKLFEQFILEKEEVGDLHKIYLAINPKSGHRWWSYKDFAGDNFFVQVTLENYKDLDINSDYPVLTYNSKVTQKLLDEGLIKKENVYNLPEFIKNSGSKAKFHELLDGDENIPKTTTNKDKAIEEIGFPMIAKPAEGHSGLGIQIFKDEDSFNKADHSKLDVYSQYIDKVAEHRLITFKGKCFYWMERVPMNDKAKTGDGDADEQTMFKYIKRDPAELKEEYIELVKKYGEIFKDLPYICFDVMEDKDGKIYVIESNSQPGVPYDSTVQIYRTLFKDFYGREVDEETDKELTRLSEYMINKTLELDPKRFEIG